MPIDGDGNRIRTVIQLASQLERSCPMRRDQRCGEWLYRRKRRAARNVIGRFDKEVLCGEENSQAVVSPNGLWRALWDELH